MRILLMAVLAVFSSVAGYAAAPCDVNWSALRAPYDHPEIATDTEWGISKLMASKLMRECPAGPQEKEARRFLFEFAARQLSLDYVRLTPMWEKEGAPLSEGGEESIQGFEERLRDYISSIVDPKRDAQYAEWIVKEGHAAGIAKFGPSVVQLVEQQIEEKRAVRSRSVRFVHSHDAQLESINAMGLWIAARNTQFSATEKSTFSRFLLRQLPNPLESDRQPAFVTVKILEALSQSADQDLEKSLFEWTNSWMRRTRSKANDSIPNAALIALKAIAANGRGQ